MEYEEIGDFAVVIRCECGRLFRVKIPVLLCKPLEESESPSFEVNQYE